MILSPKIDWVGNLMVDQPAGHETPWRFPKLWMKRSDENMQRRRGTEAESKLASTIRRTRYGRPISESMTDESRYVCPIAYKKQFLAPDVFFVCPGFAVKYTSISAYR